MPCDGQDTLTVAESVKPDLILLDWNMPVMDGITFLKTYRGQGNTTPIIMVTTESEKERVMEAIQSGVNNYIIKHFTPKIMEQRIGETLKKAA